MSLLAGWVTLAGDVSEARPSAVATSGRTGVWQNGPFTAEWDLPPCTPEAASEALPLLSSDGRWVLLYSGRVDNRQELINRYGLSPGASDGVLLLAAVSGDGAAGWRHVVGDFVVVAWDRVARCLWLARDAIGHRPLFYARDGQRVVWSTHFGDVRRRIASQTLNTGFLAESLTGVIASIDETPLAAVQRLPAARALRVALADGDARWQVLWEPPAALPRRRPDGALVEEFTTHFTTAMRAVLRSNGPVGCELSGGLDSSTIVAVTRELTGAPPPCFSAVYPGTLRDASGECLDESAHIDEVVSAIGAASFRHDPRGLTIDEALRVLSAHGDLPDWPFADPVRWPLARAAAAQGCRVLLNGVGGDQWLTGTTARITALIRRGHLVQAWRDLHTLHALGASDPFSHFVMRAVRASAPTGLKRAYRRLRPAAPWPDWISADLLRTTVLSDRLEAIARRAPLTRDPVLWDSLVRFSSSSQIFAREGVFRTVDDAGLEARSPYFDRRLVEFVLTLPDELRFRDGQTRFILRRAFGAQLPSRIAVREDKASGATMHALILKRVLATLGGAPWRVVEAGWIDGRALAAAVRDADSLPARPMTARDAALWNAVSVECFLRAS